MRVKHLIRELQKCNPEAQVFTEGCDCIGNTRSVEINSDGSVFINREIFLSEKPHDNDIDTTEPLSV